MIPIIVHGGKFSFRYKCTKLLLSGRQLAMSYVLKLPVGNSSCIKYSQIPLKCHSLSTANIGVKVRVAVN
jgi:hypothetical protein